MACLGHSLLARHCVEMSRCPRQERMCNGRGVCRAEARAETVGCLTSPSSRLSGACSESRVTSGASCRPRAVWVSSETVPALFRVSRSSPLCLARECARRAVVLEVQTNDRDAERPARITKEALISACRRSAKCQLLCLSKGLQSAV